MQSDNKLDTFQKLFTEIAYDWDDARDKGFKKMERDGWSFNKTAIWSDDNGCWLRYKEHLHEVDPKVYEKFLVLVSLVNENIRVPTIYVDGVDFQHELGETECKVFASKEQTLERSPCSEKCGVVKAKVVLIDWVQPQHLA